MNFKELILKNRSYRRFDEKYKINAGVLEQLIDLARFSASAANMQPLKYIGSADVAINEKIFKSTKWAGYFTDWEGPAKGERPSAYIIILQDLTVSAKIGCDHGIAAQSILLGAAELGLGGCMIGSVDQNQLRIDLEIGEEFQILLIIALGKPVEQIVLEETDENGNIKYYRDETGTHHVPKRPRKEVVLKLYQPHFK